MSRFASNLLALAAAVGLLQACVDQRLPTDVLGKPSRTLIAFVGQEIKLTLFTIGPGQYASPPGLQGSAVQFLDMSFGPANPGGPTQVFRFEAVNRSQSVLTFTHTYNGSVVTDTVLVLW